MGLIVQKYGGTSVATVEQIEAAAQRAKQARDQGHQVLVVASAMGKETDRLADLAEAIGCGGPQARRELDALLATGEQASVALLAMALLRLGAPARSFTGAQADIRTDAAHTRARILNIDTAALQAQLDAGTVPVVAGFQGADADGNITTLGRGGSDTTAVALAAALNADECRIYTDVEGVFTTDPRLVEDARRLDQLTYEEMLELASLGSRVLHGRAVEFAGKYQVPLRVLSSTGDGPGTLICAENGKGNSKMEKPLISGIASAKDEAKLTILGVQDVPGVASAILGPISEAGIEVDMIVQNVGADQNTDFTFTVRRGDYAEAKAILERVAGQLGAAQVTGDSKIAKLSLVGVGMRSHAGVASQMFKALAAESVNIQMISTSEIKISVVIDEKYLELAVRALHAAFNLAEA